MKPNKLLLALTIISFGATLAVYGKLPDEIPVHWGIDGNIDRYGQKYMALITGALGAVMYLLMLFVPRIDPRRDSYEKHMGAYKVITLFLVLFLIGIHWLIIAVSLGYQLDIALIIKMSVGILFIVIGNYMPVIKHNYTLGIRVPWTLANETVWQKTHKIGGYGFVICGIIWFVLAFINSPWVFYFLISVLVLYLAGIIAYSYFLFRKETAEK